MRQEKQSNCTVIQQTWPNIRKTCLHTHVLCDVILAQIATNAHQGVHMYLEEHMKHILLVERKSGSHEASGMVWGESVLRLQPCRINKTKSTLWPNCLMRKKRLK